jgi:uncharacterized protein (TIGR02300 family)
MAVIQSVHDGVHAGRKWGFDSARRTWQLARRFPISPSDARGPSTVPKPDLGVKRTCPETGKKFYDLNKDPIVSPFTGKEYPVSYFDEVVAKTSRKAPKPAPVEKAKAKAKPEEDAEETEEVDNDEPELDEEPIDLGDDEDEDDDTPKPKRKTAAAPDEDMDGFSDEEADLEDDDDDTGVLLDDDDDDDLGDDLAVDDDDED